MTTSFRVRKGLTVKALPDGDAVVASESGANAVIINASAHAIVELLAEEMTEDELVAFICETFPEQDRSVVRSDVSKVVNHLVQAGIVEPCGSASSTA